MKNVEHVERAIDDFIVTFTYLKEPDKLSLSCDRDLKNVDILLMLTQLLSMVEEEYRDTIVDLSKQTIALQKKEKLQ